MAEPAATETLLGLPAIWSGIVVAGIALLGTIVGAVATNIGATRRLKLQLDHDTAAGFRALDPADFL
ncbi:hypothetical protein ACG33_08770 [Steroidobacter denitrificans]|uniref:Uncharacterized protein n=1 Tax=Steroidobacter denitrificans TaxID=465721 RepID=A0A127FC64_STEDE|nr:hypothetical protein [Steroidobacter denitrificans]AMN47185.1 hypothetical protein ACG33_08770 [Steroidobacter denitrificans]